MLFPAFLFLHVLGAIVAFGPTFAFPIIGAMARREPMHGTFALRLIEHLERRVVIPVAGSMLVTGIGLIWSGGFDLFAPSSRWLISAIVVYAIAMSISVLVMLPNGTRMVQLLEMPAGGPGAAAAGPSPEFLARAKRAQQLGMVMTGLLLVIIFLMVFRPTA